MITERRTDRQTDIAILELLLRLKMSLKLLSRTNGYKGFGSMMYVAVYLDKMEFLMLPAFLIIWETRNNDNKCLFN